MKIEIDHDAEASARDARQNVRRYADMIEAGTPLNSMERQWIAGFLRAQADNIQAPSRQGPPAKLPEGDGAAIEFAILVNMHDYSKNCAREQIAEKYDVSVEAVRKYLKKNRRGEEALAFVPKNQS